MHDFFKPLFDWYQGSLDSGGYLLVALLMAIESSIVPLPSELIIPPAAIVAQRTGNMSLVGIVIAGTIGSWVGATVMYWVSRIAGRPFVISYGKFARISPQKVEHAEQWSAEYGPFGVFASRLLPVVRHLIGIPAGVVRMNFLTYSIYTIAGSAVWCSVLTWVGVKAGQDQALMNGELHRILIWMIGALAVLGVIYYLFVHRVMARKKS
jgi:membrane protein DedA with SNARE-associated domain